MSLGTTTRKCAVTDDGASICATKLNDPNGFTLTTRSKLYQSNNKLVLRLDDLSKRNINVTSNEQGSPKKGSVAVVGSSDVLSPNLVESTDSFSCMGRELLSTDVSFPLPPYICTRFNTLLEEMLEKMVNLHSIVRRHSQPSSLSTSFDGKSSSSPFVDTSSDNMSLPQVNSHTIETEGENKKRRTNRPIIRRFHKNEKKNDLNYTSSDSSSSFVDSLSLEEEEEEEISDDILLLNRLLDDDYSPEMAKSLETKSTLIRTTKHEDNPSSDSCGDAKVDVLASFLDEILDIKEEKKEEDILKLERKQQHGQRQQPNVNLSPIVLTPTTSTSSILTTDDLLLSVGGGNPSVGNNNVSGQSSKKKTVPLPPSSSTIRENKIKREKYMKSMETCVDSIIQLRDFMETRIKHAQLEVDAYYSRYCDCVSSADLAKKQSRLNEAVKKLCIQTDRLNTTQLLLRQEKSRLQVIQRLSEKNAEYCTGETNSTYKQSVSDVSRREEHELGNTVALASSPVECFCRTASPLHSTNLLARDVLSHRRQLSRLVEIFRACPEAVEQWALMLQQEADDCHVALEKIFWDSQREKEKLLHAFEIISWEDL
ncbi:uncharacterized protein TM35_000112290 [Trypanosoma theileri]|uniref:Uncharacterized protein n=1 Tax=Trypanosoma theileri TaxID=67003 RepID=A0A1X0NYD2_9TRYP|nr:uncharacterized protein TM35_000112290 [Trypanosoma theileri]ORC89695.1 hypothetical protein TM35_000112290 [Trypanosoma theileri]